MIGLTVKELLYKSNITLKESKQYDSKEFFNSQVYGISYNSKEVKSGYLFFAIKGTKVDGHEFVEEAFKNGAVAAVV
uniref:Mur ligase N-terminal catalytic domain-containing protein n=1 Tax=Thermodesulfobium narugense TaxID=184064 RepID=A0A7C5KB32_9BACT